MSTRVHLRFKRYASVFKVAVTLTLLAITLRMIDFGTLEERFRTAKLGWLCAAAVILVIGGFAGAASWFCVLRLRLSTLRFRDAAACHWIGMFFNSFLPSNIGGDVVKGYLLLQTDSPHCHSDVPASESECTTPPPPPLGFMVTSLLIDRAVNLGMLLVIGGFALLFERYGLLAACWALGLVSLTAVAGLRLLTWAVKRRKGWGSLRFCVLAFNTPRRRFPFLLAAFASQFLKTWSNVFVVLALGLKIPLVSVWSVIPLFGLVSALPISIGGLGVREWVAQGIATPLHVDNTHLVALSLAGHILTVLVNLLGALPLLLRKRISARQT